MPALVKSDVLTRAKSGNGSSDDLEFIEGSEESLSSIYQSIFRVAKLFRFIKVIEILTKGTQQYRNKRNVIIAILSLNIDF